MKKLNMFTRFDWEPFAKDKKFMCIGVQEWKDFSTGTKLGTQIDTVIVQDGTHYGDGTNVTNLYEKISFKVPRELDIPLNVEIRPKGVVATVYGEFRNQLSAKAEDVVVVK